MSRGLKMRRTHLYRALHEGVDDEISEEELDIHFSHMPVRYWPRVTEEILRRHLGIIHEFFASLRASDSDGTTPVVRWRHAPERGVTEIEVCSWDRLGLLAKVAGAFAAVRLNIVRADIFTRADNVVLDVFEVCEAGDRHVQDDSRLQQMAELLAAALRCAAPTTPVAPRLKTAQTGELHVGFDLERADAFTVLLVEADDQLGLLHQLFTALAECRVNIAHAIVTTENGRAGDVFFLTDEDGRKITDAARLKSIRARVLRCLR